MSYQKGDKAYIEVEILYNGDGVTYCFPEEDATVYDCIIKMGRPSKDIRTYISENALIRKEGENK